MVGNIAKSVAGKRSSVRRQVHVAAGKVSAKAKFHHQIGLPVVVNWVLKRNKIPALAEHREVGEAHLTARPHSGQRIGVAMANAHRETLAQVGSARGNAVDLQALNARGPRNSGRRKFRGLDEVLVPPGAAASAKRRLKRGRRRLRIGRLNKRTKARREREDARGIWIGLDSRVAAPNPQFHLTPVEVGAGNRASVEGPSRIHVNGSKVCAHQVPGAGVVSQVGDLALLVANEQV